MNLLILFGIKRNCLWSRRGRTFYLSIRTVVIIGAYHFSWVSFFSGVFKFMIVSLPINLVLCFQGNFFIIAYIFLNVRI